MNLRTAKSVLTILVVVSGVLAAAGWTLASWSDSVTSTGNVFATGNLDLQQRANLSDPWSDDPVVGVWHATNMHPGQDLGRAGIQFLNKGSIHGSAFEIAAGNSDPDLAKYIEITEAEYQDGVGHHLLDQSETPHISDVDSDGHLTLWDLEHSSITGLPVPDTSGSLVMRFMFRADAGNELQGKSDTANFTFTLKQ
jgi:predicted ribosomally synthesized peptide with SipW-like signal peptide